MNRIGLYLGTGAVCSLLALPVNIAAARAEETAKAPPPFKLFRYDEDYRYLRTPALAGC